MICGISETQRQSKLYVMSEVLLPIQAERSSNQSEGKSILRNTKNQEDVIHFLIPIASLH